MIFWPPDLPSFFVLSSFRAFVIDFCSSPLARFSYSDEIPLILLVRRPCGGLAP